MMNTETDISSPREVRRLAAIVCADVVGYSRLMQRDESGTHARIMELGAKVVVRSVENQNGRVVKTMGDGFLMEFTSVSDAFAASISIQERMFKYNKETSDDAEVFLRIGLHIGDVIVDGTDIFGEGVIIASRLEGLAEPCGILVSQAAYEQLKGTQTTHLISLGIVELKNIERQVEVWQWSPFDAGPTAQDTERQAVPRSTKPSVAVIRFQNFSSDEQQEYFVRGICEDLQSSLSKST
jgi:adenylate cyclase